MRHAAWIVSIVWLLSGVALAAKPENAGAFRVTLKLDRQEFILGESIAIDYEMTNIGKAPAPYERGGDYPTLRINDGYRMSATRLDEHDEPVGEPVANWPMPEYNGGIEGNFKLEPKESHSTTLFVTRYVRFLEPGRYRLLIQNVDRNTGRLVVHSTGDTILTLKQPTQQAARAVFERTRKQPRQAYDDNENIFLRSAADFEAMHQSVYLPIFEEFARQGNREVGEALERMQRPEANAVLVDSIASALDRNDWQTARVFYQHLKPAMPFPNWFDKPLHDPLPESNRRNRDLVAQTWKAEFVPVLIRLAKRLFVEVAAMTQGSVKQLVQAHADDPGFRTAFSNGSFPTNHPQSLLIEIDFIYRCVGRPEDLTDMLTAYDKSIELTKDLPVETGSYRPRGSASGFKHTAMRMLQRGAQAPVHPRSPGEAATFVVALRTQPGFRPEGWQAEIMKWLRHGPPYLAEVILESLPEPVPEEVLDYLPTALAGEYVDLQIAACHVAKKHPRAMYREPLKKILETAKDKYLREYATEAARANGLEVKAE